MCYISYHRSEGSSGLLKRTEYCERTTPGTLCKYAHEDTPSHSDTASIRSLSSRAPSVSSYPTTPTSMAGSDRFFNLELRAPESSKERREYHKERKHKSDKRYLISPEIVFQIGGSSKKDDKKDDFRRSRSATNHRTMLSPIDAGYYRSSSDHRPSSRPSTSYSTHFSPHNSSQRMPFAPDPPSIVPDAEPVYIVNSSRPRRTQNHGHTTQNEVEYPEPPSPTIRRQRAPTMPVVVHQPSTPYRLEERKPGWMTSSQSTRSPSAAPSIISEASSWGRERDAEISSMREEKPGNTTGSRLSKDEKARRQAEYDEQERIRWLNRVQEREDYHRQNEERRRREEEEEEGRNY